MRSATWSAGRSSETFTRSPRNIARTCSSSPRSAASLRRSVKRVVGDAVLRVVQVEPGRLRRHALAAAGVAVEELAEVHAPDLVRVPLEPPPGRGLAQRLSHVRAPRRARRAPRYACAGSFRQKIALPATRRSAPASRATPIVSALIPPSTCTRTWAGSCAPQLLDPLGGIGHEGLTRVAGMDRHAEDEVRTVGRRDGVLHRGLGVEREPHGEPVRARLRDVVQRVLAGLDVERDAVSACARDGLEVPLGTLDHQVAVEDAAPARARAARSTRARRARS